MITDRTLDETLFELLRCQRALEALRVKRKEIKAEQFGEMYLAPKTNGEYLEADVAAALSAPFVSPCRKLRTLNAAAKRASMDLTRKLASLRAGR